VLECDVNYRVIRVDVVELYTETRLHMLRSSVICSFNCDVTSEPAVGFVDLVGDCSVERRPSKV
jgi:hypothetical protein